MRFIDTKMFCRPVFIGYVRDAKFGYAREPLIGADTGEEEGVMPKPMHLLDAQLA